MAERGAPLRATTSFSRASLRSLHLFPMTDDDGNEQVQVSGFTSYSVGQPPTNVILSGADTFESCRGSTTCSFPAASCPGPACSTTYVNPTDPANLSADVAADVHWHPAPAPPAVPATTVSFRAVRPHPFLL